MQHKRSAKGFWAVLLSLLMVVAMLPMAAFAQDGTITEVKDAQSLKSALENGGNVKLTDSFSIDEKVNITITKPVTLDLNGQTVTKTYGEINHFFMTIKNGGSLTLEDSGEGGALIANSSSDGYGIQLYSNSTFIMNGGKIETTQETVDIYTITSNVKVEINDGELVSTADSVLGVRGDSGIDVDINGGTLTSAGRTGVYISTYSKTPIDFTMTGGTLIGNGTNSGVIQAYQGVILTVTGDAEIQGNGCYGIQAQENTVLNISGNSSITSTGLTTPAISASDKSQINISGGTISSKERAALRTENDAFVTISGGSLTGSSGYGAIEKYTSYGETNNSTITITGGNFSSDVSEYIDDNIGMIPNPDGDGFIVGEYIAFNDDEKYISIQDAINHANPGDTILVSDGLHQEHIVINRAITLKNVEGEFPQVTDITAIGNIDGLTLQGLTFVGASNISNLDTNLSALYLQGSPLIKNVDVIDCDFILNSDYVTSNTGSVSGYATDAITTLNVEDLMIQDCTIDGYTMTAYHNPGQGGNITYDGNTIKNVKSGIAFIATNGVTVTNNSFENANGIRLEDNWGGGDKCSNVVIDHNKFISVSSDATYGQYAVRMQDSNGNPGYEGTLQLRENYWGEENPNFSELVVGGTANVYPYFIDEALTQLVDVHSSITLNYEKAEMKVGETLQLTATILPQSFDQSVVWVSGDEKIATVDQNGLVTAKAKGTVTIAALDASGREAICVITVTDKASNEDTASEVTPSNPEDTSTPNTGDSSNAMPWMIVMFLALSASVASIVALKKNRQVR